MQLPYALLHFMYYTRGYKYRQTIPIPYVCSNNLIYLQQCNLDLCKNKAVISVKLFDDSTRFMQHSGEVSATCACLDLPENRNHFARQRRKVLTVALYLNILHYWFVLERVYS